MRKEIYVDAFGHAFEREVPDDLPEWKFMGMYWGANPGLYFMHEDGKMKGNKKPFATQAPSKSERIDFDKFSNQLHNINDVKSSIEGVK